MKRIFCLIGKLSNKGQTHNEQKRVSFILLLFQIKTTFPDVPASVVYDVLHDQEYRSYWDKYCLEVKDIGHLNPNNTVCYYASKSIPQFPYLK